MTRLDPGIIARGHYSSSQLVDAMAADLLRLGATASESEAICALSSGPYRLGDVAGLVDEALQEARRRASAAREHHQ